MHNLSQKFEEHGYVFDYPRTGTPRTAMLENKALICQIVIQSPMISTNRLALVQGVSKWPVQWILHYSNIGTTF